MAFKAIRNNELEIYSFSLNEPEWNAEKLNKSNTYTMPCCQAAAVLKTSKLGVQFFAHKADSCNQAGESVEHQFCKYISARALIENGWSVEAEKRGSTPDGAVWIADVYAEKDGVKLAIEVQWSDISGIEIERRNDKYLESGVHAIWLCRNKPFAASKRLPIFSIGDDFSVSGFRSSIDYSIQQIELTEFINTMVCGKVKKLSKTKLLKAACSYRRRKCKGCNEYSYNDLDVNAFIVLDNAKISFSGLSDITYDFSGIIGDIDIQDGLMKCKNCNTRNHLHNGSSVIKLNEYADATITRRDSQYDEWIIFP
jgi:hypothetical protein